METQSRLFFLLFLLSIMVFYLLKHGSLKECMNDNVHWEIADDDSLQNLHQKLSILNV